MDQMAVLDEVSAWVSEEENIRLVVVTGSVARGDGAFDELSDLDLELYVRDPAVLLDERGWYERFGRVLVVEELESPGWHPTRLVHYVDGKIDFMIGPTTSLERGVRYDRPYRVVVDKDRVVDTLHATARPEEVPPAPEVFKRSIEWFYAAALMWAKALIRGEPWLAKVREWEANSQLLHMIEWDHKARFGWGYDTWYLGGHMRQWMDPDVIRDLERCFADISIERMGAALSATVELFDRLSVRTAAAIEIEAFDATLVREEINKVLDGRYGRP